MFGDLCLIHNRRMGVCRNFSARFVFVAAFLVATSSDDPWLAGKTFTLAEVGFAPYVARLQHLGLDELFNRHPRVSEWSERLANRPSVIEGVARWFNPKYLKLFEGKRAEAREQIAKLLG